MNDKELLDFTNNVAKENDQGIVPYVMEAFRISEEDFEKVLDVIESEAKSQVLGAQLEHPDQPLPRIFGAVAIALWAWGLQTGIEYVRQQLSDGLDNIEKIGEVNKDENAETGDSTPA